MAVCLSGAVLVGCGRRSVDPTVLPPDPPSPAPPGKDIHYAPIAPGDAVRGVALDEYRQTGFSGYYERVETSVEPGVEPYTLPLKPEDIANYAALEGSYHFDEATLRAAPKLLLADGLAVTPRQCSSIRAFWDDLDLMGLPPFITSDCVLHAYHLLFRGILERLERDRMYPDLIEFSAIMQAASQGQYRAFDGALKEAALRNWAYFTVGKKLLVPSAEVPDDVGDMVAEELKLIEAHVGMEDGPVLGFEQDYSQYVPRGHYAGDARLEPYFKAMMWYGRSPMLLLGSEDNPRAAVSQETADRHTVQAMLIAAALFSDGEQLTQARKLWQRLSSVPAFMVGAVDDLTPVDYASGMKSGLGESHAWTVLADAGTMAALRNSLRKLPPPKLFSGLGGAIYGEFGWDEMDAWVEISRGLRLFSQCYNPDALVLERLSDPTVGKYTGRGRPFTLKPNAVGVPVRGIPRGLDVFHVLGSQRAGQILVDEGDTEYEGYPETVARLQAEMSKLSDDEWHASLAMAWLDALRELTATHHEPGWPTFMSTSAWEDRCLSTVLASRTQLRHDTILYAKQAAPPCAGGPPSTPQPVVGYVEPVPEFWARLLAMTQMTLKGLTAMDLLDQATGESLRTTSELIEKLHAISVRELEGKTLRQQDYDFIDEFGDLLEDAVSPVQSASVAAGDSWSEPDWGGYDRLSPALVIDTFTELDPPAMVLQEGVGEFRTMLVAYKLPQGHIVVGAGPVFSYYEFKHPSDDRLTDEKWREMLNSGKAPKPPKWTQSSMVGK
jgi:hypothetical protein